MKEGAIKKWDETNDRALRRGHLSGAYQLAPIAPVEVGNDLGESKFEFTNEIAGEADWTNEAIADRQHRLAELAVTVWPRS